MDFYTGLTALRLLQLIIHYNNNLILPINPFNYSLYRSAMRHFNDKYESNY